MHAARPGKYLYRSHKHSCMSPQVGFESFGTDLPEDVSEEALLKVVADYNADPKVCGGVCVGCVGMCLCIGGWVFGNVGVWVGAQLVTAGDSERWWQGYNADTKCGCFASTKTPLVKP